MPSPPAAARRAGGEHERQLGVRRVPGRHRGLRQQHRPVRGDARAPAPPRRARPAGPARDQPPRQRPPPPRRHQLGRRGQPDRRPVRRPAARCPCSSARSAWPPAACGGTAPAGRGRRRGSTPRRRARPARPSRVPRRSAGRPVRSAPAAEQRAPAGQPAGEEVVGDLVLPGRRLEDLPPVVRAELRRRHHRLLPRPVRRRTLRAEPAAAGGPRRSTQSPAPAARGR